MNIKELIRQFEADELKKEEFHHKEHLELTLWYLENLPELEAIVKIKGGILKYNLLYKVPQSVNSGYHETITMFFIKLVQSFIKSSPKNCSFEQRAKVLTAKYAQMKTVVREYYSMEVIRTEEARKIWVEPNLKPIA